MRTERKPEEVRKVAMEILGIEISDLIGREKSPTWLCRAREAVTGAMYNLSSYQPSFPELGMLTGKRHHSTVHQQVQRYNRDWPPALRIMWEASVVKQLGEHGDE